MDLKTLENIPSWEWPEDAQMLILGTLSDKRATEFDRVLAASLGGDLTVMNDELAEILLAIVSSIDESDELRSKAAISLGPALEAADLEGFDEPEELQISKEMFDRIQETFHRLFLDKTVPKEVRRRVLEAAVRSPQAWHADGVRKAYDAGDEEWRLTAVFCMRYIKGFDDQIIEALGNENSDIQYEAVRAAAAWEIKGCWPSVARLLKKDTEKFTLLAAIEAAAAIHPEDVSNILGDFLESEDSDIAEAALDAISQAEGGVGWDDDSDDDDD
jgi:HEAT repeat protein